MTKDLKYYSSLKYPYTIEEEEENGEINYVLEIPDLPGCWAQGKNLEEARRSLEESKDLWIEEGLKRKLEIPEPSKEFSGRILLRIPPFLHGQLSKHARKAGLSLNQFIRNILEAGLNVSGLVERLDRMEKTIQAIQQQLILQNRIKGQYTIASYDPGATADYCRFFKTFTEYSGFTRTNLAASSGKNPVMILDSYINAGAGLQCVPNLEKEKEEVTTER